MNNYPFLWYNTHNFFDRDPNLQLPTSPIPFHSNVLFDFCSAWEIKWWAKIAGNSKCSRRKSIVNDLVPFITNLIGSNCSFLWLSSTFVRTLPYNLKTDFCIPIIVFLLRKDSSRCFRFWAMKKAAEPWQLVFNKVAEGSAFQVSSYSGISQFTFPGRFHSIEFGFLTTYQK